MIPDPLPVEEHLDLLLAFASIAPSISAYEQQAQQLSMRICRIEYAPEARLISAFGFRVMLFDGHLARVHAVAYFPYLDDDDEPALGIATTDDPADLRLVR